MNADHYCDECGKKMKRTAKCEFYCKACDKTIFDWSLKFVGVKRKKEHKSDFSLAKFCRGGDLNED